MRVFHVTPIGTFNNVWFGGLDPAYSQQRLKRVWVCDKKRLAWTVMHLAARKRLAVQCLEVIHLNVPAAWLARWRPGIYVCYRRISHFHFRYHHKAETPGR